MRVPALLLLSGGSALGAWWAVHLLGWDAVAQLLCGMEPASIGDVGRLAALFAATLLGPTIGPALVAAGVGHAAAGVVIPTPR